MTKFFIPKNARCALCGREFTTKNSEHVYCSNSCRGKRHWKKTKDERPEVYRARYRKKLKSPLFRLCKNHRSRLWELCRNGHMVKDSSSMKYFGCPVSVLKRHIETQFKRGMRWENYGSVWSLDHIIPIARFDLGKESERKICFNWQNLRPMFSRANMAKSDSITEPQQHLALSYA